MTKKLDDLSSSSTITPTTSAIIIPEGPLSAISYPPQPQRLWGLRRLSASLEKKMNGYRKNSNSELLVDNQGASSSSLQLPIIRKHKSGMRLRFFPPTQNRKGMITTTTTDSGPLQFHKKSLEKQKSQDDVTIMNQNGDEIIEF